MQEEKLVQQFRDGDKSAFEQIFSRYQNTVYSICFRFTKNSSEAEDLCQDVFLQIYKSLLTFRSRSKLSTWIYRIAVNKSLNYLRGRKKTVTDIRINQDNQDSIENVRIDYLPAENRPDKLLELKEKELIVRRAIDSLPENQRVVLILQKFEGFSTKEIAEILDCTLLSVQSRLHRAKKNLAKQLSAYLDKI